MTGSLRLLIFDDAAEFLAPVVRVLSDLGRKVTMAAAISSDPDLLEAEWDAALTVSDAHADGFRQALDFLREKEIDAPLIVLAPHPDVDTGNRMLELGADDYVAANDATAIAVAVMRAVKHGPDKKRMRAVAERLRIMDDLSFEGIFIHDREKILDINRAMLRMTGYERDEAIGLAIKDVIAPRDMSLAMGKVMAEDESPYQSGLLRKDGSEFMADLLVREIAYQGRPARFVSARDVTLHKEAEEARIRIEESFRRQFENFPVPSFIWRLQDGRLVFTQYNQAAHKSTGGAIAEHLGETAEEYFSDRPELAEAHYNCVRHGKTIQREIVRTIRATGETMILSTKMVFGPPDSVFAYVENITEAKTSQRLMEQLTENLTQRVKELRCGYMISGVIERGAEDRTTVLQKVADLVPEGFRYPGSIAVRLTLGDQQYLSGSFSEPGPCLSSEILVRGQTVGNLEVCHVGGNRLEGVSWFIEEEVELLKAVAARLGQVIRRWQTEEELRRSEERYRQVVDNTNTIVIRLDPQGHFTYFNPYAERFFGWKAEEILGLSILDTITPLKRDEDRPANEWFGEILAAPDSFREHENANRTKDGREVWVAWTNTGVRDEQGRIVEVVCTGIDATERKRIENDLREAKKEAESANEAKSLYLANMSHEIRTPMNAIIGLTELVLDSGLPPEQQDNLSLVKLSAESLLNLLNDILDFSKIEAGRLQLEATEFNLRDTLGESMKALALRAHEKGLELAWRVDPKAPEILVGDPGRLRQLVLNLAGNAVKFTEKGEVVLDVRVENSTPGAAALVFTISDTGPGISRDQQQSIFQAFFQTRDGRRAQGGTGLGLAICRQLVEMMGGRLWVESEPGLGSTFYFTARFAHPLTPPVRKPVIGQDKLAGLPVLLVDDNDTNRHILGETLRDWGLVPTSAAGGPEALEILTGAVHNDRPFPLILVDVIMPDMDGFELVRIIRAHPDLRDIVVIMLTPTGLRGDATLSRELGVAAYLAKPIRDADLRQAIQQSMSSGRTGAGPEDLITRHTLREDRRRLRILLVEDNKVNRKLATSLLGKKGHEVVVAENGREAVDAFTADNNFDLVLMDVQMPVMDGLEATKLIREFEASTGGRTPIAALTAHAMKGDRQRFLEAGMDECITKPFQASEFFNTIVRLTSGDTANSE